MFCTNCGKQLEDSQAGFCTECGAPISALRDNSEEHSGEPPSAAALTVPWRGRQVAWGLLFMVIGVFILLLAIFLVVMAVTFLRTGDLEQALVAPESNQALLAWVSSLLVGLVILFTIWYLGLRPTGGSFALLGLRTTTMPAGRAALWAIGALFVSLASTALYSFIMEWIGVDWLLPPENYGDIVFGGPAVVLTFMALALWTPLTEELFFRGSIFAGLVHRFGVGRALVFSAAIFSLFHLLAGPGVLIPIFITGFLLAWLYHRTGSLWPSIAAHAGQNGAALLAAIYGPSLSLS